MLLRVHTYATGLVLPTYATGLRSLPTLPYFCYLPTLTAAVTTRGARVRSAAERRRADDGAARRGKGQRTALDDGATSPEMSEGGRRVQWFRPFLALCVSVRLRRGVR
eukprot:3940238-Rhodomonas_salina.5